MLSKNIVWYPVIIRQDGKVSAECAMLFFCQWYQSLVSEPRITVAFHWWDRRMWATEKGWRVRWGNTESALNSTWSCGEQYVEEQGLQAHAYGRIGSDDNCGIRLFYCRNEHGTVLIILPAAMNRGGRGTSGDHACQDHNNYNHIFYNIIINIIYWNESQVAESCLCWGILWWRGIEQR